MHRRSALTAALFSLPLTAIAAGSAWADVRYEMETRDLKGGDAVSNEILVKDGMLRMTARHSGSSETSDVIYLPEDEEVIMIDHQRKEVRRMTKEDMARVENMMAGMSQKMQDAMKNMPPEARAQAEQMMKRMGQGGGSGAMGQDTPKTTVERMGGSDTVAGIDCDMYAMMRQGEKAQEFCAADADDLRGGEELVEAMGGLAQFMEGFTQAAGGQGLDMYIEPVEGKFPVLGREFEDGKAVTETRLTSVEEVSLGDDQFTAPEGYRERELME